MIGLRWVQSCKFQGKAFNFVQVGRDRGEEEIVRIFIRILGMGRCGAESSRWLSTPLGWSSGEFVEIHGY